MVAAQLSRRSFLEAMAILPLASHLNGGVAKRERPRVVVVGAGAFGGWTALHLARLGAQVTLIDAWGPGNSRSSSGGETRVIRAVYGADRIYVEMVKRSYEMWDKLDASTDETLYVQTGALWMHRGDDAYVRSSVASLGELGFPLEKVAMAEAARRYPQIRFEGVKSVWLERRAGALFARRACAVVRDSFVEAGGRFQTGEVRPSAIANGMMRPIELADGSKIEADAFVFACGPWLGRLFPEVIGDSIRPTRQEVLYFGTPPGSTRYLPAELPVWIDFGEQVLYGIPDVDGRGLKVADDTRGELFDPTSGDRTVTKGAVDRARQFLAERFPELADAPLQKGEICQYENSPDGHLIVDRHPAAKNVWLLGGGSGHGFKLSPAVGEIAAEAVLKEKETPKMFRIDRLEKVSRPATQFERGKN